MRLDEHAPRQGTAAGRWGCCTARCRARVAPPQTCRRAGTQRRTRWQRCSRVGGTPPPRWGCSVAASWVGAAHMHFFSLVGLAVSQDARPSLYQGWRAFGQPKEALLKVQHACHSLRRLSSYPIGWLLGVAKHAGGAEGGAAEQAGAGASGDGPMAWEEERLALDAIFDEEVSFPAERRCCVACDAHGTRLTLDFRIPLRYPDALPCVAVRCWRLLAPQATSGACSASLLHVCLAQPCSTSAKDV